MLYKILLLLQDG